MPNREQAYQRLVAARRTCNVCRGLANPAAIDGGRYDGDAIGPWSAWQGNLDAQLMVVGQDYSDVAYFTRNGGVENPRNRTNLNLVTLLASVGIRIGSPGTREGRGTAFFTNAILCLKTGGMQASVSPDWFAQCGHRFLRAQIDLVRPRVVVGLGERAHNAVRRTYGLAPLHIRDAVTMPGDRLPNGVMSIGVYHCGARVVNAARRLEQQVVDWQRVAAALGSPVT
jgi:DNA polymerase